MSVPLRSGDRLVVECTYLNDTGVEVHWGESTSAEMCFAIVFRYPAIGGYYVCGL